MFDACIWCVGTNGRQTKRPASRSSLEPIGEEKPLRSVSESPLQYANCPCPNGIVTINISGLRFQTAAATLRRFPDTLLGSPERCQKYYNKQTEEYFFDRHRSSFESILYFYQSGGHLKRPEWIPVDVFVNELKFFEMGHRVMEMFWQLEGYRRQDIPLMPRHPFQRKVWQLVEHPDSSLCARVFAFFSVFVIVVSTLSFCLETLPDLRYTTINVTDPHDATSIESARFELRNPFFVVEVVCICWFTVEFLLRIISSPSKWQFCKSVLNVIDFIAILPFFINLILSNENSSSMSFAVLRVLRLVRVFRIFKLSRHSRGLQILGRTFRASIQELCLLIFFLCIGLVLFSSAIYFAESGTKDSKFDSIPATFWYVVVTMTTVGYGDLVPVAPIGKLVGSLCAIVGVLVLALPVPVIVANFKHYYRLENRLAYMILSQKRENADVYMTDGHHSI